MECLRVVSLWIMILLALVTGDFRNSDSEIETRIQNREQATPVRNKKILQNFEMKATNAVRAVQLQKSNEPATKAKVQKSMQKLAKNPFKGRKIKYYQHSSNYSNKKSNKTGDVFVQQNWWCDAFLGCLWISTEWYNPVIRPMNQMPGTRAEIGTKFKIYTRTNPTIGVTISASDITTISSSPFSATRLTKIITHGWMITGDEPSFVTMTTNFLTQGDYNVIRTNWGPGASNIFYPQAASNTRVVGLEIAALVNTLVSKFGANPQDFHLIGHSLGAHVSGYAGIGNPNGIANLGRITGLDPAAPWFNGMPTFVTLDSSDALYVDTLHTNTGLFGIGAGAQDPMSHLAYYANGGKEQPGCGVFIDPPTGGFNAIPTYVGDMVGDFICSHGRAFELFSDSLISTCQSVAYACDSYKNFQTGYCTSCGDDNMKCAPFGIQSINSPARSRTNLKLYFNTAEAVPFCVYHYGVKINLVATDIAHRYATGYVVITIQGNGEATTSVRLSPDNQSGAEKIIVSILMTSGINVGQIQSVSLTWTNDVGFPGIGICNQLYCPNHIYVQTVVVTEMNKYPESVRLANTFTSCPSPKMNYVDMTSGSTASFTVADCPQY